MYPKLSVHQIKEEAALTFSASDYSLFKYGRADIGSRYGAALYAHFIAEQGAALAKHSVVVFASPYHHIVPASAEIAHSLFRNLQANEARLGLKSVQYSKITRQTTYIEDYGSLNFEARLRLIKDDNYQFTDPIHPNDILLFVDDIHVTGSHQLMIEELIRREQLTNPVFFLYYIAVDSAAIDPQIENRLNFAAVQGVDDLPGILRHPDFCFNTRIIKYILRLPKSALPTVLKHLTPQQLQEFLRLADGNHYDMIAAYQPNYQFIKSHAAQVPGLIAN